MDPAPRALHGYFSRELAPALTIDSGDVVSFQTLDAGWGAIEQEAGFSEPRDYIPRGLARDVAHELAPPHVITLSAPEGPPASRLRGNASLVIRRMSGKIAGRGASMRSRQLRGNEREGRP